MTERRPNRAHGAIDQLPPEVQLQIRDWYVGRHDEDIPRLTYDQISDRLLELGHKISKSQIHRWIARQRDEINRLEAALERAQILTKYLVPEGVSIENAAASLAGALCLEALADASLLQVKGVEDLAKVSMSIGRLRSSNVAREKWEQEKSQKIEAAVSELKAEVQRLLEGNPELTRELFNVIDAAKAQMTEKAA